MKFSKKDIKLINDRGLTEEMVSNQIDIFKKEIRFIDIKKPATVEDGILLLSEEDQKNQIDFYDKNKRSLEIVKFTPASGAASRMFKFLFNFLDSYQSHKQSINSYINKRRDNDLQLFFIGLDKLPFYQEVINYMRQSLGEDPETMSTDRFCEKFVQAMLLEEHLNYGNLPKGLLTFHKYKQHTSTAYEEHLFEANHYICNQNRARLHFTISPQHEALFKAKQQEVLKDIEEKTDCAYEISYSFQQSNTDTITVDTKNRPIRDESGNLMFRPGGHGSLIENLNNVEADVIFIKNIDNVVVNSLEPRVTKYKKILGGKLIELQQKAHDYCKKLIEDPAEIDIDEVLTFVQQELNIRIKEEFEKFSRKYQIEYLIEKLDRPLRVCGMVKNENEPGGGPFWVKHESGYVSLQIVESAQINKKNEQQKRIFEESTHFNPVDIVCGVRNYKGEKYNLKKFVDKKAYFIASKSKSGKKIKALERPGLWNGGMAFWNTVFIEVPLFTFNPVKTVNDLLKPAHQKIRE